MPAAIPLKPCPASGEGVHKWVCYAACTLVEAGMSDEQAESEIEALMTREPNPHSEIEDALRYARGERHSYTPRWTPPNAEKIAAISKEGPTLIEFVSRSPEPIRFEEASESEEIVDAIFRADSWLCVGRADWDFHTERREFWRGKLEAHSLIVPSPMSGQMGQTKQGKPSYHCADNTGPRRFLVIEFDSGILDQQAALLWYLAQYGPLALVVFSGNKSIHGWFFCEGQPEDEMERFFDYAHSLGACDGMWRPCQFARMPDGMRSDGKTSDALAAAGIQDVAKGRQAVLYFNPGVIR